MPPIMLKPTPKREPFTIIEFEGLYLCDTPSFFRKFTPDAVDKVVEFREWWAVNYSEQTAWVFGERDVFFTSLEQATLYKLRWAGE